MGVGAHTQMVGHLEVVLPKLTQGLLLLLRACSQPDDPHVGWHPGPVPETGEGDGQDGPPDTQNKMGYPSPRTMMVGGGAEAKVALPLRADVVKGPYPLPEARSGGMQTAGFFWQRKPFYACVILFW